MAKLLEYNATLEERSDLTTDLAIFKIRLDKPLEHSFEPGQYVTMGMNNEKEPILGSVRRPMSIASAPEEGEALEFYIRYVNHPESKNPLTHLLWNLSRDDRLYIRPKAVGHFTISHTIGHKDDRNRIFVAAGTGLAPFVSITRSQILKDKRKSLSNSVILHGASYPSDLGYKTELTHYRYNNNLHYHTTVSRPTECPQWDGDRGRVENYFLPEHLLALEKTMQLRPQCLSPHSTVVYICGLQGTIGHTIQRLLTRGFIPDNRKLRRALSIDETLMPSLFYEQYDTIPVIDIKNERFLNHLRKEFQSSLKNL